MQVCYIQMITCVSQDIHWESNLQVSNLEYTISTTVENSLNTRAYDLLEEARLEAKMTVRRVSLTY